MIMKITRQNWLADLEFDDGGERRGSGQEGRDAAHVPRLQGSAADHRRRVHGDGVDASSSSRQGRLAPGKVGT